MSESKQTTLVTNLGRIAGAIGVVLLVSAPFTWLLTEEVGVYLWGKLLAGVLLVGFYLFTNADFFARLAGSRSTGLWGITIASSVIVIGVVGVLNFVVLENDLEVDLTREGLYTLSDQTEGVLRRLEQKVEIKAFFASWEAEIATVEDTLERYARASENLDYEIIAPQQRPDLVERYNISERGPRIVVLAGEQEARAKEASEAELTNAIVRVAAQTSKVVAFLTGHGEPDIDEAEAAEGLATLADAIRAEGYEVRSLSLLKAATAGEEKGKIDIRVEPEVAGGEAPPPLQPTEGKEIGLELPPDVSVLVIAGSQSMLFPPEIAAIEAFLDRGGRVVLAVDPNLDSGVGELLYRWKVEPREDLVVDANVMNRLLGLGPAAPMVYAADDRHPIIADLEAAAVMFTVRSLAVRGSGEPRIEAMPLLVTDESAWGETNPVDGAAEQGEDDNLGPVTVGVAATKNIPSHEANRLSDEARLVVFGDSDWLNNRYLPLQGNADLIINSINWMASEEEKISIGRKMRNASMVFLSFGQLNVLKFVALDLLWILYVAVGLGIVLVRRQK